MKHRRLFLISSACVLFVCWVILSPILATRLIVERRLERADVILVLAGSAAYKERTRLAAELFARGVSAKVLISDDGGRAGWSQAENTNLPFVELARRELIRAGVPAKAIVQLPGQVDSTMSEAVSFSKSSEAQPIRSLLLVTSPYHTRRAYSTFDHMLSGRGIEIGIVSTAIDEDSPLPDNWWLNSSGWQNVAGEYVKTLSYWVFYW